MDTNPSQAEQRDPIDRALGESAQPGDPMSKSRDAIFDNLRGVRDTLSVKRVFGEAIEVDGVSIIPVARVGGGGGAGAGAGAEGKPGREGEPGTEQDDRSGGRPESGQEQGQGFGTGFGLGVTPVGVYQVRDGAVEWKPVIDVNRVVRGGQVLAGPIAVCVTLVFWRRRC